MNRFSNSLKSIIFHTTACSVGFVLFVVTLCVTLNITAFNSTFHNYLIQKHKIYDHTINIVKESSSAWQNTIQTFFKKGSPEEIQLSKVLNKSTTPEMVKYNLNLLISGMFEYWQTSKSELPDIVIENSNILQLSIRKINLGTLLEYLNRNDIINILSFVKFLFITVSFLFTVGSLSIFLILFILYNIFYETLKFKQLVHLGTIYFSVISFVSIISLCIPYFIITADNMFPLNMSIFLPLNVIYSYFQDVLGFIIVTLITLSALTPVIIYAFFKFFKIFLSIDIIQKFTKHRSHTLQVLIEGLIIFILIYFVFSNITVYAKTFRENYFDTIILKTITSNTYTEVIPAKNANIYKLNFHISSKENLTLDNISVLVEGVLSKSHKQYNSTFITDKNGEIEVNAEPGNFKLQILPTSKLTDYTLPSPVFFSVKMPGTTVINIVLDKKNLITQEATEFVEMEIFNKSNSAVESVEIILDKLIKYGDKETQVKSITNSEGIAMFKLPIGEYTAYFAENTISPKYLLPKPLSILVQKGNTVRYTIRLALK